MGQHPPGPSSAPSSFAFLPTPLPEGQGQFHRAPQLTGRGVLEAVPLGVQHEAPHVFGSPFLLET